MSTPFISQIETFAFGFAPKGWLQCNGQLLAINQNQALFSLLGTTYGGNGTQNFALPDLRGRVAIGFDTQFPQGAVVGEENHTLQASEVPSHTHTVNPVATNGTTNIPSAAVSPAIPNLNGNGVGGYSTNTAGTTALAPTSAAGNSAGHSNMMPYNTLTYCIAITGIFPSRN